MNGSIFTQITTDVRNELEDDLTIPSGFTAFRSRTIIPSGVRLIVESGARIIIR